MNMNKIYRILFTVIAVGVVTFCYAGNVVLKTTTNGTVEAKVNDVTIAGPSDSSSDKTSADQAGGTTVTLEIAPTSGYYLYQLAITPYASGGSSSAPRRAPTLLSNITPTKIDDNEYTFIMPANMAKVEISATFAQQGDLSNATITLQSNGHTYDFLEHTPKVNSVVLNSVTLTEGTDYTVSGNGPVKDVKAGGYTITVTGKGKYYGTKDISYTITPRSIEDATINLSDNNFLYLKDANQVAHINGVYINGQILTQGGTINGYEILGYYVGDYSSSTATLPTNPATPYTSSTIPSENAGTYTIVIKGKGNFDPDTRARTKYIINKKDISTCTVTTTPTNASFIYDGEPKTLDVTVIDTNGKQLSYGDGNDYTLSGNTKTATGGYTATVSANNINYTGSIDVPFTINVSNDGYYICSIADQTYTGEQIKPDELSPSQITVKKMVNATPDDNDPVLSSSYYRIVYSNNINVGIATVTAIGKGGYDFMATQTFKIIQKNINNASVTVDLDDNESFTYNGSVQKPTMTVKDGTMTLVENKDYTYAGETNADTHAITISGMGNYNGTKTFNASGDDKFTIQKLSLNGANITLSNSSYVYDGTAKTPTVEQVKIGTFIVPSTEYTYTEGYSNNTAAGTATVTVSPSTTGNLSDSKTANYTIDRKPVSDLNITLSSTTFSYNGSAQGPTVDVYDPGIIVSSNPKQLTKNTDYTLTFNSGVDSDGKPLSSAVGSYTVTITGTGNYIGSVTKTYVINYGTSDSEFIVTVLRTYTYTGNKITPAGTNNGYATEGVLVKRKVGTNPDSYPILDPATDYTLTYSNNTNAGTATVIATGKNNYQFVQTAEFTIDKQSVNVDGTTITISYPSSATSLTYNGSPQTPIVSVTDANSRVMTEGTDFTVNEGATNVGNHNVTITGIGNYKDSKTSTTTYTISQRDLSASTVILNQLASYIYDGSNKEPGVKQVTFGSEVVASTEYTVVHSNNKNAGTATVTVTGQNNHTGTTTATFDIQKKALANNMITFDQETFNYDGSNKAPTVTMQDMSGSNNIIQESDCDISIPTSSAVGTYTVNVSAKETGNYSGSASRQYSIIPEGAAAFDIAWTGGSAPSPTYDGNAQEPAVTVTNHSTNTALNASDYDIAYSNNKNAGTATVTVTGKANYSGTKTLYFTINKKPMTDAMLTLTGGSFTYNGSVQKPTATVSDEACPITTNDYVINNEGNINAGTHTVTATATDTGNYSGSSSKTYTISPYALTTDNTTITLNQTSLVYDGTAKTPEVQLVKVGSDLVVPTYTTVYANNTNAAAATAATAPQVTVTGTGNFTGSAVKKFTITPKTVTTDMILFDQENFTYNAAVQRPVVTVKDGDKPLTVDTDYTLTNEGGTNIGTYYAQIEGKGNYQGTAKRGYSIVTDGASMFTVNDIESVTYDGTEKTPEVVVLDNVKTAGTTLTENVHYTKNYINNKNAGIASVIITGIGSYAGTITKNFTINPKALTEEMVVLAENSFAFNSLQQKPTVTVSDGTIMTENDYTITNNGGVNCGTYHVVVTGKGNYTGEIDKTFTITQLDISTGTVTLYELQSYAYDGKPKKPGVREIIVGKVTVPTTGYTTSYGDNINVGKGTVTVTGQGDFRGTKTVEFEIIKKTITADMITLSNQEYTYNGSTHKPEVTVKDGETTLKLGTDYTLTNNGGVNAGTYDVTITGIGNYTGSVTKNFTIRVQEAGVFVMSLSQESMVFTGSELKPVVTVKDSEKTLTEGTHYTVTYNNNINVGVATVMVEGIGQYKGSKMKTFIITPKTLTDAMVTLSSSEFTYNVMQQRPVVTVQDGSSLTLNDYVVTNDGGVNVGTYKVTVIGKNNYMGSVEKSFSISSLDISEAKVILYELANYVYDGTAKNPGVREVGIGTIVVPTSSYTSEISDNVNAGKVTVTVTGSGNFSGSASTSFNILQKPLSEEMVSLDKTSFPYNEKKQKPVVTVSDGNIMTEADYTITNEGGTEEGTYDVIVTGKNNYTGTITKKYDIIRSDMPVDVKPGDENPGADDATISVTPVSKGSNEVKVSDIKTTESESVTIPETCTINGQTYTITGIADGAFANASNLKDLYLPETEEPLTIGKDAIPAAANVHVPLSLLAQYALMPAMAENFRNGKVMTTVKAKNRYWTFSSGVDVYVPDGLDVYIAREHNGSSVSIIQLTDNELAVGGQRVIKANNGVLINSSGNDTPYTFVACPKRMTSGTAITTDDNKDYGLRNCLIPVIVATHFESGNYYFMKNNEFYRITDESEDIKVPAGKAVLYLKSAKASARVRLVNGTTDISSETIEDQQDEWYTIEGLKLDGRPTKEGIYIHNKKKVYIRK